MNKLFVGGLSNLDANIFSRGLLSNNYLHELYRFNHDNIISTFVIFFVAFLSDLLTYLETLFQLSFALSSLSLVYTLI